jgi:hypothetical protein
LLFRDPGGTGMVRTLAIAYSHALVNWIGRR